MFCLSSLIVSNLINSFQSKFKSVFEKMYNLISFFCSYFVLILLNLPVSNLTNKNLSPCTNKYFLTKSDDQSTESNGLLYKDIVSLF